MCMFMHLMDHSGHDAHALPAMALQEESLLATLKRRYALGDITREQFQEMKNTLGVSETNSANDHAHHS